MEIILVLSASNNDIWKSYSPNSIGSLIRSSVIVSTATPSCVGCMAKVYFISSLLYNLIWKYAACVCAIMLFKSLLSNLYLLLTIVKCNSIFLSSLNKYMSSSSVALFLLIVIIHFLYIITFLRSFHLIYFLSPSKPFVELSFHIPRNAVMTAITDTGLSTIFNNA